MFLSHRSPFQISLKYSWLYKCSCTVSPPLYVVTSDAGDGRAARDELDGMRARGLEDVEAVDIRLVVDKGILVGVPSDDGELVLVDRVPRGVLEFVPGDGGYILDFLRWGPFSADVPVDVDFEGGARRISLIAHVGKFSDVVVRSLDMVILADITLKGLPAELGISRNF